MTASAVCCYVLLCMYCYVCIAMYVLLCMYCYVCCYVCIAMYVLLCVAMYVLLCMYCYVCIAMCVAMYSSVSSGVCDKNKLIGMSLSCWLLQNKVEIYFCIDPYVPREPQRDPSNRRLYKHEI